MGKKKKQTQRVTEYYTSLHYGICHGVVERLVSLRVNEKIIGKCARLAGSEIIINQPELFGGLKKEGGLRGRMAWQDGSDTQLADYILANKRGKTPETMTGYRGIATAFFSEWGRTDLGPPSGLFVTLLEPLFQFLTGQSIIANLQPPAMPGFYWGANQPIIPPVHFRVTRIDRSWRPDIAAIPGNVDVASYAVCIAIDCSSSMIGSKIVAAKSAAIALLNDLKENAEAATFDVRVVGWSASVQQLQFRNCTQENYDSLISFVNALSTSGGTVFSNAVTGLQEFYDGAPTKCRLFVFLTDGEPNSTEDATAAGEALAATGADAYAFNLMLENTTETAKMDNTFFDGVPVVGLATAPFYLSNLFRTTITQQIDMNPAHIIRECLVNTIWGLGLPDTALDTPMFEAAAETLFEERFGLSMMWSQQAEVQTFIGEVLDHIQAAFYVNPMTGKISLKLIRNDYNPDDLEVLDPSNCRVTSFKRRTPAEVTNEIAVTWTNPASDKEEVVTLQSLGSIVANNGEIVSDNRNYYGVRRADLAAELCARDLSASTAPLATAEVDADRRFSRVVPGDVLKLTDPENGADEVVMRVMKVDYGRPGASTVQISLSEDVFSYAKPRLIMPPKSQNVSLPQLPTPPSSVEFFTLNNYIIANIPDGDTALVEPETQIAFFATTDNLDTFDMEVFAETTLPTGALSFETLGNFDMTGRIALSADLPAEVESTLALPRARLGTQPAVGVFLVIGADGVPEDLHEIALITELNSGIYTVSRGLMDTVPWEWTSGTFVRYLPGNSNIVNPVPVDGGIPADYQFRTRTSLGILPEDFATVAEYTPTDRLYAPTRPAAVTVAGAEFDFIDASALTTIDVTWANRNRITEDSVLLIWDETSVDPEPGQTVSIKLFNDETGDLITVFTGLTGTSYSFPTTARGTARMLRVAVFSVRDGLESIQGHEILLGFEPINPEDIGAGSWLDANDTDSVFEDNEMSVRADTDLDPLAVIINQKGTFG